VTIGGLVDGEICECDAGEEADKHFYMADIRFHKLNFLFTQMYPKGRTGIMTSVRLLTDPCVVAGTTKYFTIEYTLGRLCCDDI